MRRRLSRRLRWLVLATGSMAAFSQTPVKQADEVCATCHAELYRGYLATPMANASGMAMEKLIPGTLGHAPSGVTYRVYKENGAAWLSYDEPKNASLQGRRKLEYFLGSGHLGVTYLYSVNNYLLESPVAYYTATKHYDMKPGLEDLHEMPPALPMEADCLRCHMSGVQHSDPGTMNRYSGLPFLHGGITCESCHGDTKAHVASGGKAAVLNPSKLNPDRRDSVCISCHLEGDVSVEKNGRSAVDFKPGDSISDYLSYFVYASAGATARGVSEVEQFSTSMCRRTSGDKMSCTSCHDLHYSPPASERVAFYRGKCLACHSVPNFAAKHHPENPDCTSCHMPRSTAQNIPHVAWTDHRILRQPGTESLADPPVHGDTLTPIFSPAATSRDLALAYYSAAVQGKLEDREKAYQLLTQARQANPNDLQVLGSLGILTETGGDYSQAEAIFREMLKLDPANVTAASNLSVLLARTNDLQGALALLRPAFNRNEDVIGLAKDLTAVECLLGDGAAARATLETTLVYSPGSKDVLDRLQQTASCSTGKK